MVVFAVVLVVFVALKTSRSGCGHLVAAWLFCLVTARYVNAAAGLSSHGAVVLFGSFFMFAVIICELLFVFLLQFSICPFMVLLEFV